MFMCPIVRVVGDTAFGVGGYGITLHYPFDGGLAVDHILVGFGRNALYGDGVVVVDDAFAGILSCWDFESFLYIEHFAINSQQRGHGLGSATLSAFQALFPQKPIVLEAEVPIEEMAIRRIQFYQRNGFHVCDSPYMQPPYHQDGKWLDLKLLSTSPDFASKQFETIKRTIYHHVYNIQEEQL